MPAASAVTVALNPVPIREDEVMLSFLKASATHLPEDCRRELSRIRDNPSYEEKLLCRQICRSMGLLQHFTTRHWYRASLESQQLKFIRLGHESSNNFSRYFSKGTYKPCVAAKRMQGFEPLNEKRTMHRDKVLKFSESIAVTDLNDVILCASKYTFNRRLKTFDGNHRLIAFAMKHGQLAPFDCIVGFSKPRYVSYLQRWLLAFPVYADTKNALRFFVRIWIRRLRAILSGGEHYQPMLKDGRELRELAAATDDSRDTSVVSTAQHERPCIDRAQLLRNDMHSVIGNVEGMTLLDVGCNIGFFCHYFATLGMEATGIENSQHNRHQHFSLSNSVTIANRMNRRYGLSCEFIDEDARVWAGKQKEAFDVVLLLSVLHHFFLGYPVGSYSRDPMEEAYEFLEHIARLTRRVLYLEYEAGDAALSVEELIDLLDRRRLFRDVRPIGKSMDFGRPIIRCMK